MRSARSPCGSARSAPWCPSWWLPCSPGPGSCCSCRWSWSGRSSRRRSPRSCAAAGVRSWRVATTSGTGRLPWTPHWRSWRSSWVQRPVVSVSRWSGPAGCWPAPASCCCSPRGRWPTGSRLRRPASANAGRRAPPGWAGRPGWPPACCYWPRCCRAWWGQLSSREQRRCRVPRCTACCSASRASGRCSGCSCSVDRCAGWGPARGPRYWPPPVPGPPCCWRGWSRAHLPSCWRWPCWPSGSRPPCWSRP